MSEVLISIGKILLDYRRKNHITLKMVYDDIGISDKFIKKIENGSLDDEMPRKSVERFVRIYVEYLNRDNNLIIEYNNYVNQANKKSIDHELSSQKPDIRVSHIWIYVLLFLLFLIIYALGDKILHSRMIKSVSPKNEVFFR